MYLDHTRLEFMEMDPVRYQMCPEAIPWLTSQVRRAWTELLQAKAELIECAKAENDLIIVRNAIEQRHTEYADLPLAKRVEAVCDALTDARKHIERLEGEHIQEMMDRIIASKIAELERDRDDWKTQFYNLCVLTTPTGSINITPEDEDV